MCSAWSPGSHTRPGAVRLKMERSGVSSWPCYSFMPGPLAHHWTGLCLQFLNQRTSTVIPTWTPNMSSATPCGSHDGDDIMAAPAIEHRMQGANQLSGGNQHLGPYLTLKCNQFWMVHKWTLILPASSLQAQELPLQPLKPEFLTSAQLPSGSGSFSVVVPWIVECLAGSLASTH